MMANALMLDSNALKLEPFRGFQKLTYQDWFIFPLNFVFSCVIISQGAGQ